MGASHEPVLLEEVIRLLAPRDGGIYVDGTLGMGGHTAAILRASGPTGKVIALEWDQQALRIAQERLVSFGSRVWCIRSNFADVKQALMTVGVDRVDGFLIDLGLSSYQLDASGRGFSFQQDEPLDMRMDARTSVTAAELVNTLSETELADVIFHYGEERWSRRIAAAIVWSRRQARIETTEQLVEIISRAVPKRFYPKRIHVATRTFQALRIAVNDELTNLQRALQEAPAFLKPGARMCVISFHSLEDRFVKQHFRDDLRYQVVTRKPVVPAEEELQRNPRARSAKLRAAAIVAGRNI